MPGPLLSVDRSFRRSEPVFNQGRCPRRNEISRPSRPTRLLQSRYWSSKGWSSPSIEWAIANCPSQVLYWWERLCQSRNSLAISWCGLEESTPVRERHVVFQQRIFVGIEFDANTINYVNTAVSSENSSPITVARQMCLRVRAQPTNISWTSIPLFQWCGGRSTNSLDCTSPTPRLAYCSCTNPPWLGTAVWDLSISSPPLLSIYSVPILLTTFLTLYLARLIPLRPFSWVDFF